MNHCNNNVSELNIF